MIKFFLFICLFAVVAAGVEASAVYVRGEKGRWYLEVDGEHFYVKGAGCGIAIGRDGTDYLKMAKELGANSVRIKQFTLSKRTDVSPGEEIEAHVTLQDEAADGLSFDYALSSAQENILQYYVNEYYPLEVSGSGTKVVLKAPKKSGTYRVYCFIRDEKGNVSSANTSIRVK